MREFNPCSIALATSTTTGALQVAGGVGIGGNIYQGNSQITLGGGSTLGLVGGNFSQWGFNNNYYAFYPTGVTPGGSNYLLGLGINDNKINNTFINQKLHLN